MVNSNVKKFLNRCIRFCNALRFDVNNRQPTSNNKPFKQLMPSHEHPFIHTGYCVICEQERQFVSENEWFRDYLLCSGCLSIPRERALFKILAELFPNWRELCIHESSPAERGASLKLRQQCKGYVESQYDPAIPLGTLHPKHGYRCENLSRQTFPDASFDVVVTQDVFEHIPEPGSAINEIARTLKPGGIHVASIPLVRKWSASQTRAKLTNGQIEHILPPQYHGNPIDDSGSLVTTDWGYDIGSFFLKHSGMDTVIYYINDIDSGIRAEYIEIVVSKKSALS